MSSIKECTLAFFKGLAFGKGLIIGRELAENKDMAEDRWITIHPFGNMKQGEADSGEGKRYYQRIFINDETDEIEGGLGGKLNGTKIKDLGKKLKELRDKKGGKSEGTGQAETKKTVKEPTTLRDKIKALTDGKEYTEGVANQVGDLMRQELEKNKEFMNFMGKLDLKDKLNEEIKSLNLIDIYQPLKEAQNKIREYMNGVHERLWTYGGSWDSKKDPEYQKLSENYDKAYIEAQEERYQRLSEKMGLKVEDVKQSFVKSNDIAEKMIGIFKNQFKDVIDFNQDEKIKCPKNLTENIDKGLALYSKDFVKTMKDNGVECVKFNGRRAYYRDFDKTVHVDKRDSLGTVAHEFAHALEHNEPVILKIEEEFYNRRTKGEKNVSLSRVTNAPYGRSEVTKLDKFIDPYMGKYYKSGDAYELLSMGMTEIYENPNRLLKDKDYTNFVLGCLAYKKGNR